jgi:hypothetical protein
MLRFIKYLKEDALNRDQEYYVDHFINWDDPQKRDTDFSDHIFDRENLSHTGTVLDRDTAVFDIPQTHLKPELEVEHHLSKRGYSIHDYEKGLAVRHPPAPWTPEAKTYKPRPISIGKILSKPHDPPSTPFHATAPEWQEHRDNEFQRKGALETFNTSSVRKMMKDKLQIMITRDPYKVAGMSTGTRWKSCIFLGTCPSLGDYDEFDNEEDDPRNDPKFEQPGSNAHRMNDILLSGTHAAYLISKGDHQLKDPHARIALTPYHSEEVGHNIDRLEARHGRHSWRWKDVKPDHTILRSSTNTYAPNDVWQNHSHLMVHFRDTLHHLMQTHFPMQRHEYHRDPMSYRDSGDPFIWSSRHEGSGSTEKEKPRPPAGHQGGYFEDADGNIHMG